jgi:hypothetical protein
MEFTSIAALPVEMQEPMVRMLLAYNFDSNYVYDESKSPEDNFVSATESHYESGYENGYDSATLYCQAVYC